MMPRLVVVPWIRLLVVQETFLEGIIHWEISAGSSRTVKPQNVIQR